MPLVRVTHDDHQDLVVVLEHELIVGRDCEGLSIRDPQVSRRHLRLRLAQGAVEVADLNSTNGSYLEGVPLSHPQLIRADSRVVIGDTLITIAFPTEAESDGAVGTQTTVRPVDILRSTSIELVASSVAQTPAAIDPESLAGDTLTIVFSDIEGSTERATSMGDGAWFALLEHHNDIIRREITTFGGREVKSIGDGFMLVFPSVRRGLRFALAVQTAVNAEDGPDLSVRMGLHTGEAIEDIDGDLFGRHINLAARIANLATGGQIIASLVVREIALGREDISFGPPAQVELKGFADPQTVFEVLG